MKLKRTKLRSLSYTSILMCLTSHAAPPGLIKGSVSDSEGSVIKNAHVTFHADFSGRLNQASAIDQARETDAAGLFKLSVEPGFYDVCVMAMAFSPECKKVFVRSSRTSIYSVRLNADPLVSEHLADQF